MKNSSQKIWIWDAAVFFTTFIWATTFPLIKFYAGEIDPLTGMFYRFGLASLMMLVWLKFRGLNPLTRIREGAILGTLLWFVYAAQMIGLRYTTPANSAFITSLFVVFVPFFERFAKNKPIAIKTVFVLVFSCLGLWFLTGGIAVMNWGDIITLITAIASAAHLVRLEIKTHELPSIAIVSFQQFFVTTFLTGIWMLGEGFISNTGFSRFVISDSSIWFSLLYLGIFPTVITWVLLTIAQAKTSPFRAGIILLFEPVFAALMSWTLGMEHFAIRHAFGAGFILVACFINMWPSKNEPAHRVDEFIAA